MTRRPWWMDRAMPLESLHVHAATVDRDGYRYRPSRIVARVMGREAAAAVMRLFREPGVYAFAAPSSRIVEPWDLLPPGAFDLAYLRMMRRAGPW